MLIKQKLGNLQTINVGHRTIDKLSIEWFETSKRIWHKHTASGKEVVLKCMNENPNLMQDDILYEDEERLIVIDILACEVMVVHPSSMYMMAKLCYEIGNKHLPIFYEEETILIPFDAPLFKWLHASGFEPVKECKKLLHPIKTSVMAHAHTEGGGSLFSKILKLTSSNE